MRERFLPVAEITTLRTGDRVIFNIRVHWTADRVPPLGSYNDPERLDRLRAQLRTAQWILVLEAAPAATQRDQHARESDAQQTAAEAEPEQEQHPEAEAQAEMHMCPRCARHGRETPSRDNVAGEWCQTCQGMPNTDEEDVESE